MTNGFLQKYTRMETNYLCVIFITVICVLMLNCKVTDASDFPLDFRITSFADLASKRGASVYSHPHIHHFSRLAVDIPRKQIIVGARNYLLRLSLVDLSEVEVAEWQAVNISASICMLKGQDKEVCDNYIRVLLIHGDRLFTCGTNAFAPRCSWRSLEALSNVSEWLSGVAKCPYNPDHNTTALLTAEGDMYSATVTDFTARDPAIYRLMGPSKMLRTVQHNSRWLNEPDFISSYEIAEFVYFLFREVAVEYINCGKRIYSRVARICKGDQGGKLLLEENWTSFRKARFNCSLPGTYPFYFDQVQGSFYDETSGLLYGVFTTPDTSIYGSAVCAYNLTALNTVFSGPFKYQENAQMAWSKVTNSQPNSQCHSSDSVKKRRSQNETPAQKMLVDAQKYQLMDLAIQPIDNQPVLVAENTRLQHLAVDHIHGKHHEDFHVLFVSTLEGVIKKMLLPSANRNKTCLIEEFHVSESVSSMQLLPNNAVLLTTEHTVIKIPLQRCKRFTSKQSCLHAQDPYCGWNSNVRQCTTAPTHFPAHEWHQNITGCPTLDDPVDGGWSEFGAWQLCAHMGEYGDNCRCRHRTCDHPVPQHGGEHCTGIAVEVTNCTSNGGWTGWSEWSACSASCGVAVRSRHRACENPRPAYGGRVCVGPSIDEQYCHDNTQCPVEGSWAMWSSWSSCTLKCGHGVQSRTRVCDTPAQNGQRCHGNDQEWKICNAHPCPELKKVSEWTPWIRRNTSHTGSIEERYRYVCRANVADHRQIRIGGIRTASRYCPPHGCETGQSVADIDGGWSDWTRWTACDEDCGGGIQYKQRLCNAPTPIGNGRDCIGHSQVLKECNIHSCRGEWGCWSDYSLCSASCGVGSKYRQRQCTKNTCRGPDIEQASCQIQPCPSNITGWDEWMSWSDCSTENTQNRKRECSKCDGPVSETKMCQFNAIANVAPSSSRAQVAVSSVKVYHLIVTAVISFALGGLVCVGMFMYCQRYQSAKQYDTLNKQQEVKPNHYMSPSELDLALPLNATSQCYSTGSMQSNTTKMTVKEATLKRNSLLHSSMRTNLMLQTCDY